jgi:hypothetical protein
MTLFNTDALGNATDLHFRILDDRTNVGPAGDVILSFLTVKEEAFSKSNEITAHLWWHPTDGFWSTQMIIFDSMIKARVGFLHLFKKSQSIPSGTILLHNLP